MKNHGENSLDEVTRQDKKLLALVTEHFPIEEMSKEYKQFLIENHYNLIKLTLQKNFVPSEEAAIKVWFYYFYLKYFNRKIDFSAVEIPSYREGFDWVIIIAQGLTINKTVEVLKKYDLFKGYYIFFEEDFSEKDVSANDRDPKDRDYAVRFRKRVEADEELKNRSAGNLKKDNIPGITLLERFIMELVYFEETGGKHLDRKNLTLCSGSHDSDGCSPNIGWGSGGGKLTISWSHPDDAFDYLRSREGIY